tara:strand:- start:3889 stop:4059 length:171 start_codon:yes stop_codon:yes gene_type:complete
MDRKGFTTESGGRQNGFSLEPEMKVISEGESRKSFLIFSILLLIFLGGLIYFLQIN